VVKIQPPIAPIVHPKLNTAPVFAFGRSAGRGLPALPERRRRGIFVEPKPKKLNPSPAFGILSHPMGEEQSPVGAAYSDDVAPDGA